MKYRLIITSLLVFLNLISCSDNISKLTPLSDNAIILSFGDSLTFGTGVNSNTQSYPAILSQLTGLKTVNAGIPDEVSGQGLKRLPQLLKNMKPSLVILCHGGNDILRRLSRQQLKTNLQKMIELIQNANIDVVLVAVPEFSFTMTPPDLYEELAAQYNIPIETDILSSIERDPNMKSDQIHPNILGYKHMGESIYSLLKQAGAI